MTTAAAPNRFVQGGTRQALADGLVVMWRNLKRIPRIPELADLRGHPVDHVRAAVRVRVRWRDPTAWIQAPKHIAST